MIPVFRLIDKCVGLVLCSFLPKKKNPSEVKRILVIKLWAVGESVLTLPMIRKLKESYPDAQLQVLCRNRNKNVYEGLSFVDEVLLFEKENLFSLFFSRNKYDLVVDCEPYLNISALLGWWLGRSMIGFSHGWRAKLYANTVRYDDRQHVVQTYADMLKMLNAEYSPVALEMLAFSEDDEMRANELVQGLKKPVFGLCQSIAESGRWRKWPAERYAALADEILEKYDGTVVIVGGKDTVENNELIRSLCKHKKQVLNLGGKTSLKELFALVKHCKLFVSNDTGPMHVAAAQGVPTIGLFGPNTPVRFAPFGKKNKAVYEKVECSPCINVHKGSFPECFNKEKGLCMKKIEVERVLDEINRVMKKCAGAGRFNSTVFPQSI